ncbi:MAG: AMP-binding protein [Acidimicrobiales bacterium]
MPSEGLHETLARTAMAQHDAVALMSRGRPTTYGELDSTADAWASELVRAGVTPAACVPILLPRSAELVIALVAVLKAGAAYALLDPTWPTRRLLEVIADLEAPLLLTRQGSLSLPCLPVWSPPTRAIAAPPDFRPAAVGGVDPCCVFFTSGTTGRAKAVVTPHRATARLFQLDTFARFAHDTVMPLAAPVPWDAFSLELWSVLLNGGTSLIVDEPYLSAQGLRSAVSGYATDTVWLTSSLFNMIVDEDLDAFRGLRQVMTGGERLSASHVGRFLRQHSDIVLINGYGPVESTIFAATHRVTEGDTRRPEGIPLGRPVAGTQVYVLDGSRICAVDETGEICIAGDGLGLRYLGDTVLTDAKFVSVPIDGDVVRIYRTGDLGAWGSDGLLFFRGRADRQLKIRGHRIEAADVERQIERVLPVRSCRVLARPDDAGVPRELAAFCVPTNADDSLEDAGRTLRHELVDSQRPNVIVRVDAFPLTERGKLDEQALLAMLPPIETSLPRGTDGLAEIGRRAGTGEGPQETTDAVAQAFCDVLGRSAVPLEAAFFDLGGNSLDAGRVCTRLSSVLGRPVPLARFYQHPTVKALTSWLEVPFTSSRQGVTRAAGAVPLTAMQLVFLMRHLVDPADRTGHCLLIWAVEGELDRDALQAAITAVHERHAPLRAAYEPDPRPVARLVDVAAPRLAVLPSESSVGAAVRALRNELARHLDPTAGEVWRTALVPAAGGGVTAFGCVVHHIAFDGWSEAVLASDLTGAYNAARGGEQVSPPPPSLARAYEAYSDRTNNEELAFHRARLCAELTGLPSLRWPAGPTGAPRGVGVATVKVSPSVLEGVDVMAAAVGVTRFVVLMSEWARTLAEISGQRDFALGVPVRQRDSTGLEGALGCHMNVLCIRLRDGSLDGGVAAARSVGRLVARALAAQDVPLADVLQFVNPPRTDRPPLYQTLFALQDNPIPHLALAGLQATFLRQPYLELPVELHAELWPEDDCGLRLDISFRREVVRTTTAETLAERFLEHLHARP